MPQRLFRITSDDGAEYWGVPDMIEKLPEEFADAIKEQLKRFSQGKAVEPVTVPRLELVKAGWYNSKEEAGEKLGVGPPPPVHEASEEERREVYHQGELHRPVPSPCRHAGPTPGNCEHCPLRDVAMKVLEKTLEKI